MTVTSTPYSSQVYATNSVTATKATSAYDTASSSQPVDKMDEMKEKYKEVYTPIPETYSKADEDLQTKKIYEAYPNYISGPDFLKIADSFIEGQRIQLGQKLTPEQEKAQKLDYEQAFNKAYELFGGQEAYTEMARGAMKIMQDYPVNNWGKDKNIQNEKELSRFFNAGVYEGLENGKSIEEAKKDAGSIMSSFMDMNFMRDRFMESIGQTGGSYEPDPINYKSLWDLREYSIDGRWEENNVYENDNAMISELEKKIGQFNFILNNKSLIESVNNKLNSNNRGQINTYESKILDRHLPNTQTALDIFKNYKIYDSVDMKV